MHAFGVIIFYVLYFMTKSEMSSAARFENVTCKGVTLVSREGWGARPPKKVVTIPMPVKMVFIHHTAMDYCTNLYACSEAMRKIQNLHMDNRGWSDLGYNYLVGEDGYVYKGRGWDREGGHTKGYNTDSVAISVMGDFSDRLPNEKALNAVNNLIVCGIKQNKITKNYSLYGHRDVRKTACPGDKFYDLITKWSHYGLRNHNKSAIIG
uniref:Peptidoglycan-recognition protein n=1 Tax=Euprymna scolopes TaxID=6613 RepID=Q32S46_EUPSC|nr:peptidoglycan recognition protein 1 [Euprymna scolopes]